MLDMIFHYDLEPILIQWIIIIGFEAMLENCLPISGPQVGASVRNTE